MSEQERAEDQRLLDDPEYSATLADFLAKARDILLEKEWREGSDNIIGPFMRMFLEHVAGDKNALRPLTEAEKICLNVELDRADVKGL
jgi:hypothetical protein